MRIDLASFAFGYTLIDGTGTPPWGTALGQKSPLYKFNHEGFQEILVGMVYNIAPLKDVWLPLGKGGAVVTGLDNSGIQLASVFYSVRVNDNKIEHPFAMILFKEESESHRGRRHIKYTPKISFRDNRGYVYSNEGFLKKVYEQFDLASDACWFVSEINISNQSELHFKAHFVSKNGSKVYQNSKERKEAWMRLI